MVFSSAAEEARLEEQPLFVYLHNHFLVFYSFFFCVSMEFWSPIGDLGSVFAVPLLGYLKLDNTEGLLLM
jgi:hypothetical protein